MLVASNRMSLIWLVIKLLKYMYFNYNTQFNINNKRAELVARSTQILLRYYFVVVTKQWRSQVLYIKFIVIRLLLSYEKQSVLNRFIGQTVRNILDYNTILKYWNTFLVLWSVLSRFLYRSVLPRKPDSTLHKPFPITKYILTISQ